MDVKNLVMAVVGMVLAAVMIGGALLPAVSSAVDENTTKFNNPTVEYMMLEDGESYTASIVVTDGVFSVTINGESYTNTVFDILHISDTSQITFNAGANIKPIVVALIDGVPTRVAECDSVTVNAMDGNIDITVVKANETTTYSTTYEWLVHSDKDGDYGVIRSANGRTLYFNNVNQLYWSKIESVTGGINYYTLQNGEIMVNGESLTNVEYSGNTVLDNVTSVLMSSGNSGFSYQEDGNSKVISWIIAPIEIIGHNDEFVPVLAMFNVLPLIAIAGLVMAGIYVFISRK